MKTGEKTSKNEIAECKLKNSKKSGKKIKASIQKTYYITSDYKVSGFIDKELNRTTLSY